MLSAENNENRKIFRDKIKNISYVKGKLLGTGGFAKCYEAVSSEDGLLYAAKVIPKKSINQKRQRYKLLIQIKIHRSLKHKHIVQFIDAFEDKENIYILLEYCRNYTLKDLAKRRKRLTQFETRIYISQIVKAMIYIHQQGVIHRDLKLGNILINDQMDTKICDFGLSTKIKNEGDSKKTICGTPNYIAPQILEEQGHSYQVDIWSIGVIMYALLFGKPPFEDNTVEQTYQNIKNNRYIFPANIPISLDAKDLINRILVMDPTKRLSLQQILQHRYMQFPQGIPHTLPVSSLAVPPIDHDKLPTRINLNDMQLQLSEEVEDDDYNGSREEFAERETLRKKTSNMGNKAERDNNRERGFNFVFIRECFKYEDTFGFLLSTGIVGSYNKAKKINYIFEFGQQFYYIIGESSKPQKIQVPQNYEQDQNLVRLFHFKAFFITKYSLFKLQQMRKRTRISGNQELQGLTYLKKVIAINDLQIVTRLSNNIIQLHFSDLTSLAVNRQDEKGIYYINKRGNQMEINYHQCKNIKLKTKIRRFSNLIQKLSSKDGDEEEEEGEYAEGSYDQEEDEEEPSASYGSRSR